MPLIDEVCGSSIDDELSRLAFSGDHIGLEALTAGDRGDEHFLTVPEVCGLHEIKRDCDAAFIIDISVGYSGAVNLGF